MSTKFGSLVVTLVITPLVWLSAAPARIFVKLEKSTVVNGTNCVRTERAPFRGV